MGEEEESRLRAVLRVGSGLPLQTGRHNDTASSLSEQVSALSVGAGFGPPGSSTDAVLLGNRLRSDVFAGVKFTMTGIMGEPSPEEKKEYNRKIEEEGTELSSADIDYTKFGRTRLTQLITEKGGKVVDKVPESLDPREASTQVLVVGSDPGYVKISSMLTLWRRRLDYCEELLLRTFYQPPSWMMVGEDWKLLFDPTPKKRDDGETCWTKQPTKGDSSFTMPMYRGKDSDGVPRETVKTNVALNDPMENYKRLKRLVLEKGVLDLAVVSVDWMLRWVQNYEPGAADFSDDALKQVLDPYSIGRQQVSKELRGCTQVENSVLRRRAREHEEEEDEDVALCDELKKFRAEWASSVRTYVEQSNELRECVRKPLEEWMKHANSVKDKFERLRQEHARDNELSEILNSVSGVHLMAERMREEQRRRERERREGRGSARSAAEDIDRPDRS